MISFKWPHVLPWLGISALALTVAGCAAPIAKEPRVICQTEHGLTFTTRYDIEDDLKCVTNQKDEGEIFATSLSRGGRERFYLRIYARNKATPNERIDDVTPESLIKMIDDGYARSGNKTFPYRLDNETVSTVDLSGAKATLRERHLIINGNFRALNFLFFETPSFEYAAALQPYRGNFTESKADSMTQEVIRSLAVQ